ncbi:MAG: hypothetical protein AYK22_02315 [Thermoplasmatales archaeon SG8-52-3]|nr:MAG: hypothetical protein AYK22_02315 [Thermoplasmatales archaeon SG8-52-3]
MKLKTGNDEFCLHCMEWREYDSEGRCKICKHIIHSENKKSDKDGYSSHESDSVSFEESGEDTDSYE